MNLKVKTTFFCIFFLLFSTTLFAQVTPSAPTGLRVIATECGKITLAWDDYPLGLEETKYSLYHSDSENGPYSYFGVVDANILTFSDRGLAGNLMSGNFSPNRTYYYKISATFSHLETALSGPISSSFTCPKPDGLTVNSNNCGEIQLHWNDFGDLANETGYNIFRSEDGNNNYSYIGQVGANIIDYTDSFAKQSGVIYNYKVNGSFNNSYYTVSESSDVTSITYNCNAPVNFRIANTSCGKIDLAWDDYPSNLNEVSFNIYRSDNNTNNFNLIKILDANTLAFADTSYLSFNTIYFYQIRAKFSNNITSSFSSTINGSFTCPTPANLQAQAVDCGNINLTWSDINDETGYTIFVYDNKYPDNKHEIGTVGANITSFSAKGHYFGDDFYSKAGGIYKYVVSAKYYQTLTNESNVASGSFICLSPPNPSFVSANCNGITISWQDFAVPINETGYNIYASTAQNGYYSFIGSVAANILTYTFSNYLASGITYYFKIAGRFNNNITDLSSAVSGIIDCEIPTGPSVTNIGCDKLTLNWAATPNATGYQIYRAENNFEGEYYLYTATSSNSLSIEIPIQQNGTNYFKIKAVFGTNTSKLSNYVGPYTADCSAFPIPTGLKVISTSCGSISISWDDIPQPFNETSYILTRYRPTEDGFSNYEHTEITLDANTISNVDTRPYYSKNNTYYYRISAEYNGIRRVSAPVSLKMICDATGQLTVTNGINCNGVSLSWTDFAPNFDEVTYEIYRAKNEEYANLGYFEKIKELPSSTLSYVDFDSQTYDLPIENNLHYYKIIAKSTNTSIESNIASGKYTCNSNLLLTSAKDCQKITLNWIDNEPNLANNGFVIYLESTNNPGEFFQFYRTEKDIFTYEFKDYIDDSQLYTFKLAKIIGSITTSMSNATSQKINCYNEPIISIESTDCGRISLNINTNSNGPIPDSYQIFRSGNGINGYYQLVNRGNPVPNIYHDVSSFDSPISVYFTNIMEVNHEYFYKVILFYGGVEVGNNTIISGSFNCPSKPPITGLHVEAISCNTIKLAWNSADLEGKYRFRYQVYKSTTGINGDYNNVNGWSDYNTFPNIYDATNLISGQKLFYKVQYFVDGISSEISAPLEVNFICPTFCTSLHSGPWNDPTTWMCGRVPTALDNIIINPGHVVHIIDNTTGNAKSITNNGELLFGAGATIILNPQ